MITVLTGAAAGAVAGAVLWRWLRTGRYRIVEDEPRLPLTRSWLVVPAATVAGGLAGALSGPWLALAAWVYLVGSVAIAWIDLDVHRIPDQVLRWWAPALAPAVAASALTGEGWPLLGTAAAAAGDHDRGVSSSWRWSGPWGWVTSSWPGSLGSWSDPSAGPR